MNPVVMMACASMMAGADLRSQLGSIPPLRFENYVLPNGLRVILHEDHSTPIVCVNVWYHVGSKNEGPGRTGFAHLFEHMMFQGSQHLDRGYFQPLQEAGGQLNGSTNPDRTNYWETVPSNYLERAVWMESDRMGFLLPALSQQKLDNQRDVVKNERRQSYENRPYGLAHETLLAAMYPPEHPYSWPTIGFMADLDAASREDVAEFFRCYYHPGNASLCIAGDFQPAEARRLVEKYFGPLPGGPPVTPLPPQPVTMRAPRRIQMTDRVSLARLYLLWPTVPAFAPDDAELEMLADLLAGGKTSRLHRRLVREAQLAQDVRGYQQSGEIAGAFAVTVTARQGAELGRIESLVREELRQLQAEPPTEAELRRAVSQYETHAVRSLESISGFGGRADQLNMYNVYRGDPGYLTVDLERHRTVNCQGIQRVAAKYLGETCVTLEVLPGRHTSLHPDPRAPAEAARRELARRRPARQSDELRSAGQAHPPIGPHQPGHAQPAGGTPPAIRDDPERGRLPQAGPEPTFQLPPVHRAQLSNGMRVLVVEHHELPSLEVHLVFPVGQALDPPGKYGLAALMADVWDEGTQSRSALQIAEDLAAIGASLTFARDADSTVARLNTLAWHAPATLEILGDVLQNPAFPEPELDRERAIAVGRLAMLRAEPQALANMAMWRLLYGQDHPYGKPADGTPASLRSINRQDVQAFYRDHIRPDQATAIVVGDVRPGEIAGQLEQALGSWKTAASPPGTEAFPPPAEPPPGRLVLLDKPGAAQSVIAVGLIGARRTAPDYFPLLVMNSILGGPFSSRLNMTLREDKGYTYGARSGFSWRVRQAGPFVATASVHTEATAAALAEFAREFAGMAGQQPVSEEELAFAKTYLTRGYPATFETPADMAQHLETLVAYGLPDDYFHTVVPRLRAVTAGEVLRVAKTYLLLDRLTAVVVGDRQRIEAGLRAVPLGHDLVAMEFDEEFRLVPAK